MPLTESPETSVPPPSPALDETRPAASASAPQAMPQKDSGGCRRRVGCILQMIGLVALLATVALLLAAGAFWHWAHRDLRSGNGTQQIELTIEKGDSLVRISQRLEDSGALSHARLFVLLALLRGEEKDLQAGRFLFTEGTPPIEILDRLLLPGEPTAVTVTFPEGWTIEQMARRLVEKGLVDSADGFLASARKPEMLEVLAVPGTSLDGYLFPDTYYFDPESTTETIIKRMVGRFREITHPEKLTLGADHPGPGKLSFHERVILASIIEREARQTDEMPLIASVYYNRLEKGMRMDSCATVRYALDKWHAPLTLGDLDVDSPWNTYRRKGLPPGPICNPGREALEAAFRPAQSDYLFYVYRGEGRHFFSKTLREHEAARRRFKEFWSFSASGSQVQEPVLPPVE